MERENDIPTGRPPGIDSGTLADLLRNCRDLPLRLRLLDERTGKTLSECFVTVHAACESGVSHLRMTPSVAPAMRSIAVADLLAACGQVVVHLEGREGFSPTLTETAVDQRMADGTPCCVLSLVAGRPASGASNPS